jgi:hypothetical protein
MERLGKEEARAAKAGGQEEWKPFLRNPQEAGSSESVDGARDEQHPLLGEQGFQGAKAGCEKSGRPSSAKLIDRGTDEWEPFPQHTGSPGSKGWVREEGLSEKAWSSSSTWRGEDGEGCKWEREVYICSSRLGLINMDHCHCGDGQNRSEGEREREREREREWERERAAHKAVAVSSWRVPASWDGVVRRNNEDETFQVLLSHCPQIYVSEFARWNGWHLCIDDRVCTVTDKPRDSPGL